MDHPILAYQIIYFGSLLAFPYLIWLGYRLWKQKKIKSIGTFVFLLGLSFIWARFIEPQLLIRRETTIHNTRINTDIVLIADLHIGVYKNAQYLERVVTKVNAQNAQLNVIAGDFIYQLPKEALSEALAPLKKLNRPTYIVLGNHDSETKDSLEKTLKELALINIEQNIIDLGEFQIAGLGDRWDYTDKITFSDQIRNKPVIIVAHNPDSTAEISNHNITVALSGHTHCGQVRIPYLYKKVIPSEFGFNCGLEQANTPIGKIPVYITAGTGEIALPMRLLNPPAIDLIHIKP